MAHYNIIPLILPILENKSRGGQWLLLYKKNFFAILLFKASLFRGGGGAVKFKASPFRGGGGVVKFKASPFRGGGGVVKFKASPFRGGGGVVKFKASPFRGGGGVAAGGVALKRPEPFPHPRHPPASLRSAAPLKGGPLNGGGGPKGRWGRVEAV